MKHLLGLALAGVVLSSCSGGGSTALPSVTAKSSQVPTAVTRSDVTFTLKMPTVTKGSVATRKPQYISASTRSLVITLTAQNGIAVSVPQPYAVNVSSCPTVSGIQTCSLTVPAIVGTDAFTIATYDAAQSSTTPTSLTGNVLSTASTSTTVVIKAANTFALTLNGIIHSISLALANAGPPNGVAATIGLAVTARDADGNVIIGPGSYNVPISLANSDTSGATTLSTTSVTDPSTAVTVAYTGTPTTSATFSASAPGGITATAIVLHSTIRVIATEAVLNTVAVYQSNGSSYNVAFTITNGLDHPTGVAVDAVGNIYITNVGNNTLTKYGPSGAGPILTLYGLAYPTGVAVDRTGKIYIANFGGNSVTVFAANATSSSGPIQTISAPAYNGQTNNPSGVAVDASGRIYLANEYGNVTVFSPNGLHGTLLSTISTPQIGVSSYLGIAVDASGKIYVANDEAGSVTTYTSAFTATTPTVTAGLSNPFGVAIDQGGKIYVADNTGNIFVYGPDGTSVTTIGLFQDLEGVAAY